MIFECCREILGIYALTPRVLGSSSNIFEAMTADAVQNAEDDRKSADFSAIARQFATNRRSAVADFIVRLALSVNPTSNDPKTKLKELFMLGMDALEPCGCGDFKSATLFASYCVRLLSRTPRFHVTLTQLNALSDLFDGAECRALLCAALSSDAAEIGGELPEEIRRRALRESYVRENKNDFLRADFSALEKRRDKNSAENAVMRAFAAALAGNRLRASLLLETAKNGVRNDDDIDLAAISRILGAEMLLAQGDEKLAQKLLLSAPPEEYPASFILLSECALRSERFFEALQWLDTAKEFNAHPRWLASAKYRLFDAMLDKAEKDDNARSLAEACAASDKAEQCARALLVLLPFEDCDPDAFLRTLDDCVKMTIHDYVIPNIEAKNIRKIKSFPSPEIAECYDILACSDTYERQHRLIDIAPFLSPILAAHALSLSVACAQENADLAPSLFLAGKIIAAFGKHAPIRQALGTLFALCKNCGMRENVVIAEIMNGFGGDIDTLLALLKDLSLFSLPVPSEMLKCHTGDYALSVLPPDLRLRLLSSLPERKNKEKKPEFGLKNMPWVVTPIAKATDGMQS